MTGRDAQARLAAGVHDGAIVEAPIAFSYGGTPYAVMMASPLDIVDFARGFSLTEGVVTQLDEIRDIDVTPDGAGFSVEIALAGAALQRLLRRKRALAGRTSCGLCGVEDMQDLARAPQRKIVGAAPAASAIARAAREIYAHQPLHRATRAAHCAAYCTGEGAILFAREDVGRHNALDKAVGAALGAGAEAPDAFFYITSRCSFEMVEKAAAFGAAALVARAAPTSFAVERARALGLALVVNARADVFDAPQTKEALP
jgi:FdhD protein